MYFELDSACHKLKILLLLTFSIQRVCEWQKTTLQTDEPFQVEWLPLSTFDAHSQFTLSFLDTCLDVGIDRDEIKVTITGHDGGFRQVSFHLNTELELFLKMEIRRCLRSQDDEENGALTPPIQNLRRQTGAEAFSS